MARESGFTPAALTVTVLCMNHPVIVPLWLLILILLFAGVTLASHFLFPSVRWFFRKRMERAVGRLNKRLKRPIEPFKLARRYDMIQRLIYDPQVTAAIVEHATSNKVPENVAFEMAQRFAREIVPAFSATAYFTFGIRVTKWVSRSLYRVKLGNFNRDMLDQLSPDATVIFIMNHRSNIDYMLVPYLVSGQGALSYAVGEWARIWPLSWIIRALGAFFIRRRSRGNLYRKVLARYVQMATAAGVTQAVFPEGGLSLTGRSAPPKLGLLNYIIEGYSPGGRDVIFVPVGLNYDRVLEDRFLIAADKSGVRRFRPPLMTVVSGTLWHFGQRITGRFKRFGTASVGFGVPLSLAEFIIGRTGDPTEAVAAELMTRINAVIPVLPVPLVARFLLAGETTVQGLTGQITTAVAQLAGAGMTLPRRIPATITGTGLEILRKRDLVTVDGDQVGLGAGAADVLEFYANSIAHHFTAVTSTQ